MFKSTKVIGVIALAGLLASAAFAAPPAGNPNAGGAGASNAGGSGASNAGGAGGSNNGVGGTGGTGNTGTGNSGNGIGNTGGGDAGNGANSSTAGNTGGSGSSNAGGSGSSNAGGAGGTGGNNGVNGSGGVGNTGTGNSGNGIGNTGGGDPGNGPNSNTAGNAGGPKNPECTSNCNGGGNNNKPKVSARHHHFNAGPIAVGCGIAAAGAEMIGAAVHGSDKKDPRESTIFEAGWYASACPVFLPWSLLVSALCPDNKATYEVARQAWRYGKKTGTYNLAVFTDAYGPACRTGTLAPEFLTFLKANHMPLSVHYRNARSKPVLRARG